MDVLTTFFPPILIFLIVFSAPLFHMILAAGQAVGRLSGSVRVRALPGAQSTPTRHSVSGRRAFRRWTTVARSAGSEEPAGLLTRSRR